MNPSAAIEVAACANTYTTFGGFIALQNLVNGKTPPSIVSISYGECEAENGAAGNAAFNSLYQQAVEVVVREGRGSVSLLQRALGIGYGRASRLIDFMAEDGVVGGYNGSNAREVLYTPEQWSAFRDADGQAPA